MSNLTISKQTFLMICVVPRRFGDARGWFAETYSTRAFSDLLGGTVFVQDNQAFPPKEAPCGVCTSSVRRSRRPSLSGFCAEASSTSPSILRVGSPTYGRWVGETLTAEGGEQLFVPRGFAHGYCTLEPNTEVAYKADGFYAPACDAGLAWNDPDHRHHLADRAG